MSHDNNSRLVYSTDGGMIKEPAPTQSASPFPADGTVRIRRETKGRKGAGVITIHGVPAEQQKTIATLLKKKCGTGGGLKEGIIEIQGTNGTLSRPSWRRPVSASSWWAVDLRSRPPPALFP